MFTGIIQDIAKIVWIKKCRNYFQWVIQLNNIDTNTLLLGSSISCNGCCLTIKTIINNRVSVDIIKETLRVTNLDSFCEGQHINVERSVKFGEEIGGHLVSGHVMITAKIFKIVICNNSKKLWIELNDIIFMKYVFYKGFICIDGISLTIGNVEKNTFCVFLIPETIFNTTIGSKNVGDLVNLEIDYLTKITVDSIERLVLKFNR
ncbi:MAG: riboflavin synthase subunit alpha [Buchnera aphidicola (Floraphis choui)]